MKKGNIKDVKDWIVIAECFVGIVLFLCYFVLFLIQNTFSYEKLENFEGVEKSSIFTVMNYHHVLGYLTIFAALFLVVLSFIQLWVVEKENRVCEEERRCFWQAELGGERMKKGGVAKATTIKNLSDRETTVTVDGRTYRAFISLRDMEKMQEYVQTRKEQADANRLRYEKIERRATTVAGLVFCYMVILLSSDSYFGLFKDWPTFVKLALMVPPVLGSFAFIFPGIKFMVSNPERYYSEPYDFTKAQELERLLTDADLARGIFFEDGYSKIGVIRNDTRIMEYFSCLKMKVGYHDQEYVLVEGFAEDYLDASKFDYHLRVLLPLQIYDSIGEGVGK